jgi:hypothetical protein
VTPRNYRQMIPITPALPGALNNRGHKGVMMAQLRITISRSRSIRIRGSV